MDDVIRQGVIWLMVIFITFGIGYTIGENKANGGKFIDWLDGFF